MFYVRHALQESYENDLYLLSWWMLFGEVTSIFNNIRVIFNKTKYKPYTDKLFACVFLPFRFIMTFGSIYSLKNFEHVLIPAIIVGIFAFLNIYWGTAVINKVKKGYKDQNDKNKKK